MTPPIQQGDIVWAQIRDSRDNAKLRPAVVITPNARILRGSEVLVVAITSTLPEPLPAVFVPIPWDPAGRSSTGLRRRSAAKCDWVQRVAVSQCQNTGKYVPAKVLRQIIGQVLNPEKPR